MSLPRSWLWKWISGSRSLKAYQAMNGLVCCEFRLALSRMVI